MEMACYNDEALLDSFIDLAIRQDRKPKVHTVVSFPSSAPEPMELGASQISPAERMQLR